MDAYYNKNNIVIYHKDNLEVLRNLPSKSINLIYCDILYNTGKELDNYSDNLGSALEAIEWYRPRFEEMKRVLTDDGSIFIHCNWRLDSYIRILMDNIFGAESFRNRIYRQHSKERGFYSNFDSQVDIILYYVNNPKNFTFNETRGDSYQIVPLFENGYIEKRSEIRSFKGTEIELASKNKHWLISPEQFDKMIQLGEVQIINGLPYRFSNVIPVGNLWTGSEMLDQYSRIDTADAYDTPKPNAILERIITTCSNEGDTVADFFMGGGTTAVVAKKLNRKGIFCDINEYACKVTVKKLTNNN